MSAQDQIKETVTSHPVVLFMKGSPKFPMCGFSASATQMLKACGVDNPFTVDVLQDADIRQDWLDWLEKNREFTLADVDKEIQ